MSRPTELYVPHVLDAGDIPAEDRYSQISQNLSCYGIEVADDRRPEAIVAHHTTISALQGDFCSAYGSRNVTVFDPHKAQKPSIYLSLLLEGRQTISGRKKAVSSQIPQGMLMVHERNDYYTYHSSDVKQLYILPDIDAVSRIFNGRLTRPVVSLENHHLMAFFKSHMMLLHQHSAALDVRNTALVLDGLHNMALLMLSDVAKEDGIISSGQHGRLYNAARSYIYQHYALRVLSPNYLSQVLRCSRSSLDRAFKEQGTTIMAVIKRVRLGKAREMIENDPGMKIERIAWLCGFSSAFIFSKNFREAYRVAPTVWRDNFTRAG